MNSEQRLIMAMEVFKLKKNNLGGALFFRVLFTPISGDQWKCVHCLGLSSKRSLI